LSEEKWVYTGIYIGLLILYKEYTLHQRLDQDHTYNHTQKTLIFLFHLIFVVTHSLAMSNFGKSSKWNQAKKWATELHPLYQLGGAFITIVGSAAATAVFLRMKPFRLGNVFLRPLLRRSIVTYRHSAMKDFPVLSERPGLDRGAFENKIESLLCNGRNVLLTSQQYSGKSRAFNRIMNKCSQRADVLGVIPLHEVVGSDKSLVSYFRQSPCLKSVKHGFWNRYVQVLCGSALSNDVITGTLGRLCDEAAVKNKSLIIGFDHMDRVQDKVDLQRINELHQAFLGENRNSLQASLPSRLMPLLSTTQTYVTPLTY